MKACTKCNRDLEDSEFYRDPRTESGLRSICKSCWSKRGKAYRETHKFEIRESGKNYYQRNKVKINEKAIRWRKEHQDLINERARVKGSTAKEILDELKTPCKKCGESKPWVIQFHHINPSEKLFEITQTAILKFDEDTINNEISKCVCLCANCHREFHYFYGTKPKEPVGNLNEYLGGDK